MFYVYASILLIYIIFLPQRYINIVNKLDYIMLHITINITSLSHAALTSFGKKARF